METYSHTEEIKNCKISYYIRLETPYGHAATYHVARIYCAELGRRFEVISVSKVGAKLAARTVARYPDKFINTSIDITGKKD